MNALTARRTARKLALPAEAYAAAAIFACWATALATGFTIAGA